MNRSQVDALLMRYGDELWPRAVMGKMDNAGKLPLPERQGGHGITAGEVRQRIRLVVSKAPVAVVKITGTSKHMGGVRTHLRYLTERGETLRDEDGREYQGRDGVKFFGDQFRYAGPPIPTHGEMREAFHLAFGVSQDADPERLKAAVLAFACEEFAGHKWGWAMHTHQAQPHIHLIVKATARNGLRLDPRKADLHRWREAFAHELRSHGIVADGSSRIVRGSLRNSEPAWVRRARAAGKLRTESPAIGRVTHSTKAMRRSITAWAYLHAALAESPDASDRALAAEVKEFVKATPMLGHVVGMEIKRQQEQQRQQAPQHSMDQEPGPGR